MDHAAALLGFLNGLPNAPELDGRSTSQLHDLAEELDLTVTQRLNDAGLIEAISDPASALLHRRDITVCWQVRCDRAFDAMVSWNEVTLLVRIDDGITVQEVSDDAAPKLLEEALARPRGELADISADGVDLDDFLTLLDAHVTDLTGEIYAEDDVVRPWRLDDGSTAWIPEQAWTEAPWILDASWDFLGPVASTMVPESPGTNSALVYRSYLLVDSPGWEQKHVVKLLDAEPDAASLHAALGELLDYFLNPLVFSLGVPDRFDTAEIRTLLGLASRGLGGLWINGRWWYETPQGWSCQPLPRLSSPILELGEIVALHLIWLDPACDDHVDVFLFDEDDPSRRMALCTLAAHKANDEYGEAVAWACVQLADGTELVGIATPDSERFRAIAGVDPSARLDIPSYVLTTYPALTTSDEVPILQVSEPGGSPFDEAIARLSATAGAYPPSSSGDQGPGEQNITFPPPRPRPAPPLPPPAPRVTELAAGDEGFIFLNAVGQDEHGQVWMSPEARVMRAGIPATDPYLTIEADGTITVSTRDLEAPIPPRQPHHRLPTGRRHD